MKFNKHSTPKKGGKNRKKDAARKRHQSFLANFTNRIAEAILKAMETSIYYGILSASIILTALIYIRWGEPLLSKFGFDPNIIRKIINRIFDVLPKLGK